MLDSVIWMIRHGAGRLGPIERVGLHSSAAFGLVIHVTTERAAMDENKLWEIRQSRRSYILLFIILLGATYSGYIDYCQRHGFITQTAFQYYFMFEVFVIALTMLFSGLVIMGGIQHRMMSITTAIFITLGQYVTLALSFASVFEQFSLKDETNFSEPLQFFDALYFSVTTLTTVGYGDISPKGHFARGATMLEMVIGFAFNLTVFAVTAGYVAERISSSRREPEN